MVRKALKRKVSTQQNNRPSVFFIIAMVGALAVLGWFFVQSLRTPPTPTEQPPVGTTTTQS